MESDHDASVEQAAQQIHESTEMKWIKCSMVPYIRWEKMAAGTKGETCTALQQHTNEGLQDSQSAPLPVTSMNDGSVKVTQGERLCS